MRASARRWWFVYYRVDADDLAAAIAAARITYALLQVLSPLAGAAAASAPADASVASFAR